MFNQKKYFTLEGNIGAGKSTFLKIISKYLNIYPVFEPYNKWQNVNGENLLDYFYKDTTRWAYTFQTYAFVTRIVELEKSFKIANYPIVLERSVYSDRYCFAKNAYELKFINSLEWKLYQEWFEWLIETYTTLPNGFIYLQTSPEVCYSRLLKRNRSEEIGISFDYIKHLHEKHEMWLIEKNNIASYLKEIPVLLIQVNEEFENDEKIQRKYVNKIVEFLENKCDIPAKITVKKHMLL